MARAAPRRAAPARVTHAPTPRPPPARPGYLLPRAPIANADLARLINSTEVQKVLRPALRGSSRLTRQKKNPLVNFKAMVRLNPYAAKIRAQEVAAKKAPKGKKTGTRYDKKARALSTAQYRALVSDDFVTAASLLKK